MQLNRRRLYAWHGWLGLHAGLLLFAICFSGTVAVFTPEIDAWLDPARRIHLPDDQPAKLGLGEIQQRLAQQLPSARITFLRRDPDPAGPDVAEVEMDADTAHRIMIDPYRGEILGTRTYLDFKSFVRIFHKQFYLTAPTVGFHGTLVVGLFGLILLAAVVTGLCAFPRWWRALVLIRFRRDRRTVLSDLHRFLGSWTLIASLLLALTGIWYWVEQILTTTGITTHDAWISDDLRVQPPSGGARPQPWSDLVARAEAAYPGLLITGVLPPYGPHAPFVVTGQAEAWAVTDTANLVALDPYDGKVLHRQRGLDLGLVGRLSESMDPVHFGTFGGALTRWWYLISGLALSAGILIGAALHARRTLVARERGAPTRRALWCWSGLVTTIILLVSALSSAGYIHDHQLPSATSALDGAEVPGAVWIAITIFCILVLVPSMAWLWLLRVPAAQRRKLP